MRRLTVILDEMSDAKLRIAVAKRCSEQGRAVTATEVVREALSLLAQWDISGTRQPPERDTTGGTGE